MKTKFLNSLLCSLFKTNHLLNSFFNNPFLVSFSGSLPKHIISEAAFHDYGFRIVSFQVVEIHRPKNSFARPKLYSSSYLVCTWFHGFLYLGNHMFVFGDDEDILGSKLFTYYLKNNRFSEDYNKNNNAYPNFK